MPTENGRGNSALRNLAHYQKQAVGMSKDTLTEVFDKFVRAKNANNVNVTGTGLGLFVAKKHIIVPMQYTFWILFLRFARKDISKGLARPNFQEGIADYENGSTLVVNVPRTFSPTWAEKSGQSQKAKPEAPNSTSNSRSCPGTLQGANIQ